MIFFFHIGVLTWFICLSTFFTFCLSACWTTYPFIRTYVCMFICWWCKSVLPVYLSTCWPIYPYIYIYIYLSVYLIICGSICTKSKMLEFPQTKRALCSGYNGNLKRKGNLTWYIGLEKRVRGGSQMCVRRRGEKEIM